MERLVESGHAKWFNPNLLHHQPEPKLTPPHSSARPGHPRPPPIYKPHTTSFPRKDNGPSGDANTRTPCYIFPTDTVPELSTFRDNRIIKSLPHCRDTSFQVIKSKSSASAGKMVIDRSLNEDDAAIKGCWNSDDDVLILSKPPAGPKIHAEPDGNHKQAYRSASIYPTPPLTPGSHSTSSIVPKSSPPSISLARPGITSQPSHTHTPHSASSYSTIVNTAFVPTANPGTTLVELRITYNKGAETRGRGFGVFLRQAIKKGETILTEQPFFRIPSMDLDSKIDGLVSPYWNRLDGDGGGQRVRILILSFGVHQANYEVEKLAQGDSGEMNDLLWDIMTTNGIPLSQKKNGEEPIETGIFETVSRINHSCAPNAVWRWDSTRSVMSVVAYKDVAAGDEVTCAYTNDVCFAFRQRQTRLRKEFGFTCQCNLCSLPATSAHYSSRQDDDKRMKRYSQLSQGPRLESNRTGWLERARTDPARLLAQLDEAMAILQDRRQMAMGWILHEKAHLYMAMGDANKAMAAGQALRKWTSIVDGPEVAAKDWTVWAERPWMADAWEELKPEPQPDDDDDASGYGESSDDSDREFGQRPVKPLKRSRRRW